LCAGLAFVLGWTYLSPSELSLQEAGYGWGWAEAVTRYTVLYALNDTERLKKSEVHESVAGPSGGEEYIF